MLSPITTPPSSISQEEHFRITSSTPASFADIPPILRWNDDVQVQLPSTSNGWESWPTGRVEGKLYVNEDSVAFIPNAPLSIGFNIPYVSLTLHALTPASSEGPAHLYCQVDNSDAPAGDSAPISIDGPTNGHGVGEDEDADEDEDQGYDDEFTEMREVRIYLSDIAKLEPLFEALSQCSALHDSLLPNGEPSSFFGFGAEDDDEGGEDGQWEDAPGEDTENGTGRVAPCGKDDSNPGLIAAEIDGTDQVVDQMERFLSLVDWGDVKKPEGWDDKI